MPTPKWLDYMAGDVQATGIPYDTQFRILSALAAIASGQNPDGTTSPSGGDTAVLPANILDGFQSVSATTATTTIITVPAGRTWQGTITINTSVTVAGASTVNGNMQTIISLSGAGSVPAAGNYFQSNATAGANVVAGVTGTQGSDSVGPTSFTVVAPAGNAVLIQSTVTLTGTTGFSNVSAIGALQ